MRNRLSARDEGRIVAGFTLLVAGGLSAEFAWLHARSAEALYGVICGQGPVAHCAACYAAPMLAMAGLALLAAPAGRAMRALKVSARRKAD